MDAYHKLSDGDKRDIVRKHFEKKISQARLAGEYGISREQVWRYCHRHGKSPLTKKYVLDDESIVEMFVKKKMSVAAIARKLKVTTSPIKLRLTRNNINFKPTFRRQHYEKIVPHYRLRLKIWEAKIIERDNMKCAMCGSENTRENRLEAHHIVPIRHIEDAEMIFSMENGITICRKCHMKIHYREKEFEDVFRKFIRATSSV